MLHVANIACSFSRTAAETIPVVRSDAADERTGSEAGECDVPLAPSTLGSSGRKLQKRCVQPITLLGRLVVAAAAGA